MPTVQSRWPLWSKTLSNLLYKREWIPSIHKGKTAVLTMFIFIKMNRTSHRANMQRAKDIAFSQKTSAKPVTQIKFDASQRINESWPTETLYQIPGEQQFQQFMTSGPLRQSTTQKLRPIRLIEMPQEVIIPSPSFSAVETEFRAHSPWAGAKVTSSEPILQATGDMPSLERHASRPLAAICSRCGSPLRMVQTMVYCRRCGLIVSGKKE